MYVFPIFSPCTDVDSDGLGITEMAVLRIYLAYLATPLHRIVDLLSATRVLILQTIVACHGRTGTPTQTPLYKPHVVETAHRFK